MFRFLPAAPAARYALPGAAAALVVLLLLAPAPAPAGDEPPTVDDRVAALEAQVRELQAFLAEELGFGVEDDSFTPKVREMALTGRVVEKKFRPKDAASGSWEDYLLVEVAYDTTPLEKPAVAIKGTLEFADPFGTVQFSMPANIADNIKPGREVSQNDLRFKYNQFREAHQWMNGTDPSEMVVLLRVSAIRYADGSTQEFRD